LRMRTRGIARAEVGRNEAFDACFDRSVGEAFLDVDLGAFDRDHDGVLAAEYGDQVVHGECIVYFGYFDARRVGR
jgi:hypothetical protein